MNPWILASLAACFLGAWVPPIHTQGSFEDCCLGYYPKPKLAVLRRARFFRIQEVSGSCNLFAIIFYFHQPGKTVCGNPRDIRVQKAMRWVNPRLKVSQRSDNQLTIQGGPLCFSVSEGENQSSTFWQLPLLQRELIPDERGMD
uniref:Chemokine interleukin-8-like domain-containing protein n=1 Tax=Spermophilus dauricus TaxID=99837 RepID=A0A8C9QEH3_SPEDA